MKTSPSLVFLHPSVRIYDLLYLFLMHLTSSSPVLFIICTVVVHKYNELRNSLSQLYFPKLGTESGTQFILHIYLMTSVLNQSKMSLMPHFRVLCNTTFFLCVPAVHKGEKRNMYINLFERLFFISLFLLEKRIL